MIFINYFIYVGRYWALPLVYAIKAAIFFITVWAIANYRQRKFRMETGSIFAFFGVSLSHDISENMAEELRSEKT